MPTKEEHPETTAVDLADTMDMVVTHHTEVEVTVEVAMDPVAAAAEVEDPAVAAVDHLVVVAMDRAAMVVVAMAAVVVAAVAVFHSHLTTLIQCSLQ